jgi:ubiquinone/menaquinone biosynthesis C-methylase UbiE
VTSVPGLHIANNDFESAYLSLRRRENRIYSDLQLQQLPQVDVSHPHCKEWQLRGKSFRHLSQYLLSKGREHSILEVGCGNGWLSHQLSKLNYGNIVGVDINSVELDQAKRVFGDIRNLAFLLADIRQGLPGDPTFDYIIFASSIQYFPRIKEIIDSAITYLKPKGEIHLIDSHFYKESAVEAARERSFRYFSEEGFPEMGNYYFHHSIRDLEGYQYKLLHNPDHIIHQLLRTNNPFYWIAITGPKELRS